VAIIERDRQLGGACVHRGTIPSKTLRESAINVAKMRQNAELFSCAIRSDMAMTALIENMTSVLSAHDEYIGRQIGRNNVERILGRACYLSPNKLEVHCPGGSSQIITMDNSIICTGSIPRQPENVEIDHEHIFDSDSVLSMLYIPESMTVLGGGVIACEYATIFATLGSKVTMIDRYPTPLGFLDTALTELFVEALMAKGIEFVGNTTVRSAQLTRDGQVRVDTTDDQSFLSEKLLVAAGRSANVKGLGLDNIGLKLNDHGVIPVDYQCRTAIDGVFAAGDVIGPPALASASMEQGRRASCSALGVELDQITQTIPSGIYAIPELSTVGMSAKQVEETTGMPPIIGVAKFDEIARGHISACREGQLRMIADAEGKKLLGVQIIGEGATELIHIAQMGLLGKIDVDAFVENIFNFPTLAEAYRVAALSVVGQRLKLN